MAFPLAALVCGILAAALPGQARASTCTQLGSRHFVDTSIASARDIAAGPYRVAHKSPLDTKPITLPAFCRVKGVVKAHIGFELWLPEHGWNGRLLALGSGGFGGFIDDGQLAAMLAKGYAVTVNDTGHVGQGRVWMRNRVMRRAWGHTATHDVIVPVKAMVRAFYQRPPVHSYFQGCSTGGDQAMEEAEFYPDDFDGIVAGSPGMDYSHLMLSFLWGLKVATDHAHLSQQKLQLIHRVVLRQCDAADGVKDGLLENPLACDFHPEELLCKGRDKTKCLTPQEVATAEAIYRGPRNPRTGAVIYPGFVPGSEAAPGFTGALANAYGWRMIQGRLAIGYAIPLLKNMVFGKDWNWKTFDWDHDVVRVEKAVHADIDATDPDLRAFRAHDGKLVMIQGWGDPYNAPTLPITYRARVIDVFAANNHGKTRARAIVDGFFRLFMAPGMGHCMGGPGPSRTEALAAVRAWVEKGKAPARLVAHRFTFPGQAAMPTMSRPLCPYPQVARWTGNGSTAEAANFVCASSTARQNDRAGGGR
ncbi:MAG TPA: tannase/feruloyl esterase family alpha/beta hydrolase [Rhodanobacteraceae bacterium]